MVGGGHSCSRTAARGRDDARRIVGVRPAGEGDAATTALSLGVTVRPLLDFEAGGCSADQPLLTESIGGYVVAGDRANDVAVVTDSDGGADDVCLRVGEAAVTNADAADLTVVRDDSTSPAAWRVRVGLSDDGSDRLIDAWEACATGTQECPMHEGAPAGVLVLVLGDEFLDVLPPIERVGDRPSEIEFHVWSEDAATAILTYGRAGPPAAA